MILRTESKEEDDNIVVQEETKIDVEKDSNITFNRNIIFNLEEIVKVKEFENKFDTKGVDNTNNKREVTSVSKTIKITIEDENRIII